MKNLWTKWFVRLGMVGGVSLALFGMQVYQTLYRPAPDSPGGKYRLQIESGEGYRQVGQKLIEAGVAKPDFSYAQRLLPARTLHPGEYVLDLPASAADLVAQINARAEELGVEISQNQPEVISVTIQEGWSIYRIAEELVARGVLASSEEFLAKAQNPNEYDYPFLPDSLECTYGQRTTCVAYYLEGYLYPDTYDFYADAEPDEIINKLLANFEQKVWTNYAGKVSKAEFTRAVTMASVIEVETGRPVGIEGEPPEVLEQERRQVASVFYNRLEAGMAWQSDPTVSYGLPGRVCQQTVRVENCVYLNDARAKTRYNTYQNPGYPIGPISNPRLDSIAAALNPAKTDYLFFVADNRGVKSFAKTNADHVRNIRRIQNSTP